MCRGRNHPVDRGINCRVCRKPFESSLCKYGTVPVIGFDFIDAGLNIPTKGHNTIIFVSKKPLCLSAQTTGCDGSLRKTFPVLFLKHKNITRIPSFWHKSRDDSRWELGGYVFHTVNTEVDFVLEQSLVEFFGKYAHDAHFIKWLNEVGIP